MNKVARKIIFETQVGSKLYGTNRPDSDDDFMGVFAPSSKEQFSTAPVPTEISMDSKVSTGVRNSKGDVDRKFYAIPTFLKLAGEGQSKQIEMLFSPSSLWTVSTPVWEQILSKREMFLSSAAIKPFIGMAEAQMRKSMLKGDNLNLIRDLLKFLKTKPNHSKLDQVFKDTDFESRLGKEVLPDGLEAWVVGGRRISTNQNIKVMVQIISKLEKTYGTRSEMAAIARVDFKALVHAYRLIFQTETLATTGSLSFPLPKHQIDFLMPIRNGIVLENFAEDLQERVERVKNLTSVLPETVNWDLINEFSEDLMLEHFRE